MSRNVGYLGKIVGSGALNKRLRISTDTGCPAASAAFRMSAYSASVMRTGTYLCRADPVGLGGRPLRVFFFAISEIVTRST